MSADYNVFISWSGSRSHIAAEAFHKWLSVTVQAAKPWISDSDIQKGSRGLGEISGRLQGMKVGVVFLTPENQNEPWILFEAGALSKTIDDKSRLCTYLLGGLAYRDVKFPLAMFQATNSDKEDTRKLIRTINLHVGDNPIPEPSLDLLFDRMWPDFEVTMRTLPPSAEPGPPKRSPGELSAEILEIVRAQADGITTLQKQLAELQEVLRHAPFANPFSQSFGSLSDMSGSRFRIVQDSMEQRDNANVLLADERPAGSSIPGTQPPHLPSSPRRHAHAPKSRRP